jgi:two-component system sensor histidine kinase ChvG
VKKLRLSLRTRAIAAIGLVALAPHALVFVWTQLDRPVPGQVWANVRDAMEEGRGALPRGSSALDSVAKKRGVRLRVVRTRDGAVTYDADDDRPTGFGDRIEAFFLRPAGAPTLRQIDDAMPRILDRDEVRVARDAGQYVACQWVDLLYCQAIGNGVDRDGSDVVVHVEQSSYRAVGEVYQLRAQLLRMGLLLWPIAVLLAWFTGSRIVRPIERLRKQALELPWRRPAFGGSVDRSRRATPKLDLQSGDEIGDLTNALNALLGALEAEKKQHEEFVADLVHELKSTVASVRASADALDAPEADDRTKRLARVLRESSGKLEGTVARFLDLARADAGFPREERETVDVSELAKSVVARLRDDPRFSDVTFEADAPTDARVSGVSLRLESLLRELLENGASFVPRGGRVRAIVRTSGDEVVLVVEDDGPGIPDGERDEVFRRYYTTRGHARGSGLGLALVRAVAEAHGGSAEVLSNREKGAAFEVRLPRFTPDSHDRA